MNTKLNADFPQHTDLSQVKQSSGRNDKATLVIDKHEFVQLLFKTVASIDGHQDTAAELLFSLTNQLLKMQATDQQTQAAMPSMLSLLKSQRAEQLAEISENLLQIISLIDRLFDYMLNNKHLADDIKNLISQLRVPFFKLALSDSTLFVESQHPARLFFNDMTKVGQLWSADDPKTFPIEAHLRNTIQQIIGASGEHDVSKLFSLAAKEFNQFSAGIIKRTQIFEKRIRESELGKAKAEHAKNMAKQRLQEITDKQNIPAFVLQAFQQAWEHVIFLEHLKSVNEEHTDALLTAKQLLVSLQPLKTQAEIDKLNLLRPILIERIKAGLEKTSFSASEAEGFMARLEQAHQDNIEKALAKINADSGEDIIRLKPTTGFVLDTPQPKAEEPVDVAGLDLDQWVDQVFNAIPNDPQHVAASNTTQANANAAKAQLPQPISEGSWFEITLEEQPTLGKYAGYISQSDKHLFVTGGGNKLAEYETATLANALNTGQIKAQDSSPGFEKAFDLIAEEVVADHLKQQQEKYQQAQAEQERLKREQELAQIKHQQQERERVRAAQEKVAKQERDAQINKHQSEQNIQDITHLPLGSWVELSLEGEFKKCRLAAKIASSGKYIFVDRAGIKVAELLEDELSALFSESKVKLKQKNDVFDSALASVITSLRASKSEKN